MEKLRIYLKWSAGLIGVFLFGALIYYCAGLDSPAVPTAAESSQRTVIIDAGHGGEDGGAGDNGVLEKDVNLSVALKLRDMLTAEGFRVVMTRNEDISLGNGDTVRARKVDDIKKRTEIINSDPNAILVSIHQNKFPQSKYYGTQIFCSSNSAESTRLGECIRQSVTGLLQNDNKRELKTDDGSVYILKNAEIPAVIVECGFLSNPEEAAKLADDDYRSDMAFAIMCGTLEYCSSAGKTMND